MFSFVAPPPQKKGFYKTQTLHVWYICLHWGSGAPSGESPGAVLLEFVLSNLPSSRLFRNRSGTALTVPTQVLWALRSVLLSYARFHVRSSRGANGEISQLEWSLATGRCTPSPPCPGDPGGL